MQEKVRQFDRRIDYSFESIKDKDPVCMLAENNWRSFLREHRKLNIPVPVETESFCTVFTPTIIDVAPMVQKRGYGLNTFLVVAGEWTGFIGSPAQYILHEAPAWTEADVMIRRRLLAVPYHPRTASDDFSYVNEMATLLKQMVPQFDRELFVRNVLSDVVGQQYVPELV